MTVIHTLSENGLRMFWEYKSEFTWEKRILENFKEGIREIKGIYTDFISEKARRNGSEIRTDVNAALLSRQVGDVPAPRL